MKTSLLIACATFTVFASSAGAADLVRYPERPSTYNAHRITQEARYFAADDCELLKIDYRSPYPRDTKYVNICTSVPFDWRPVSNLPSLNGR